MKAAFKSVRFAKPLVGLPPLAPKQIKPRSISLNTNAKKGVALSEPVDSIRSAETSDSTVLSDEASTIEQVENPNRRQLRPRKRKNTEAEPAKVNIQPIAKKPRTMKPTKPKNTKTEAAKAQEQPATKKLRAIQPAKPKNVDIKAKIYTRTKDEPSKHGEGAAKMESPEVIEIASKRTVITIESTDEEEP
ncbi:hypothetical protein ACJ41O_011245 [Fusarium nematophilum]